MLRALAAEDVPWEKVHLFQVDERVAPAGHPDRNLTHVRESLLGSVALPPANLHPMRVEDEDLRTSAALYQRELEAVAGGAGRPRRRPPRARGRRAHRVARPRRCGPRRGRRRRRDHRDLCRTRPDDAHLPVIDRARALLWVVTGAEKAPVLPRLLDGDRSIPAGRVRPVNGVVLADRARCGEPLTESMTEPTMPTPAELDTLAINTIRTLSIDAVQQAKSGHPGTPMALAPLVYTLWNRVLRFDPADPIWPNRDRFVLSNGHASMLLWSVLHLSGTRAVNADYERLGQPSVTLDDIKRFRQLDSKAPGHPEYRWVSGVETTTGPLGQGVATSVGMAIAEKWLAARYNRPGLASSTTRSTPSPGTAASWRGSRRRRRRSPATSASTTSAGSSTTTTSRSRGAPTSRSPRT